MPLRRTIRHLAQRLRTDGDTFMIPISLLAHRAKPMIIHFVVCSVQCKTTHPDKSGDSQEQGISFGDGNRVFEMSRQ